MKKKLFGIILVILLATILSIASTPGALANIPGDVNHDGHVNLVDLVLVAAAFGSVQGSPTWNPDADLNLDGRVNILDLVTVGMNYGRY